MVPHKGSFPLVGSVSCLMYASFASFESGLQAYECLTSLQAYGCLSACMNPECAILANARPNKRTTCSLPGWKKDYH